MCTVLQGLYEVWGCCCAASVYWIDWIMCLGSWGLWPSEDEAAHISAVMLWRAEAEPEEVACRQSLICSCSCSLSMASHVRCDVIQSSYRLPLLNHSNNGTVSIACSEDCGTADRVWSCCCSNSVNPLRPTVAIWIPWAPECPDVKNYKWRLNPRSSTGCFIAVSIWQQWASRG